MHTAASNCLPVPSVSLLNTAALCSGCRELWRAGNSVVMRKGNSACCTGDSACCTVTVRVVQVTVRVVR